MLIECPNCSLEQPLDQYCAGCGKQLDKLLVEKKQRRSARIKKTNFIIGLVCVSFISGSVYYYSNLNSEQSILSGPINSELEKPVRLRLPKAKITYNKPTFKEGALKSYATESTKRKQTKVVKKNMRLGKIKKTISPKISEKNTLKKIKTFYFISLENCTDSISKGELSLKQRTKLLACANVHFQTSSLSRKPQSGFVALLDKELSFSNQVEIKVKKFLIELNFSLSIGDDLEGFQQTLPLNIESNSAATIWPNTGHEVDSFETPSPEMLSSYTASSLFKLYANEGDIPKLYFLATYQ